MNTRPPPTRTPAEPPIKIAPRVGGREKGVQEERAIKIKKLVLIILPPQKDLPLKRTKKKRGKGRWKI